MFCHKISHSILLVFKKVIVLSQFHTETIKCSKMTPKEMKYFRSTTCFLLTRQESCFLVKNALETDDQPRTLRWARIQCKTCPFIHNVKKVSSRIHPHKRYHSISCRTLLTKMHMGQSVRLQGDRPKCGKKWHILIKTWCYFNLPHCSSHNTSFFFLHQWITELCKRLVF